MQPRKEQKPKQPNKSDDSLARPLHVKAPSRVLMNILQRATHESSTDDWLLWANPLVRTTPLTAHAVLTESNSIAAHSRQEPQLFDNEWLTTKEAADYLRVPLGSLKNMTSNGHVRFYKLGRRNRYWLPDLRKL